MFRLMIATIDEIGKPPINSRNDLDERLTSSKLLFESTQFQKIIFHGHLTCFPTLNNY